MSKSEREIQDAFSIKYDSRFFKTKTNDREKFSRRFQLKSRFLCWTYLVTSQQPFLPFTGRWCELYVPSRSPRRYMQLERNFEFAPRPSIKNEDIYKDQNIQKKNIKYKIYHLNRFCHMAWPINVERYLLLGVPW